MFVCYLRHMSLPGMCAASRSAGHSSSIAMYGSSLKPLSACRATVAAALLLVITCLAAAAGMQCSWIAADTSLHFQDPAADAR